MNKLFTKIAAFALGSSMAIGVGVAVAGNSKETTPVHAANTELTFSLTSNPGGWPTTASSTETDYNYTLNNVTYGFSLKNIKQNSGYLMMNYVAALGLPKLSSGKLTKVVAHNSSGCSTSTRVGISSSASSASYISGGAYQTYSSTSSAYTYNLSGTSNNTRYYIYVTNKNCQLTSITLTYEVAASKTLSSITVSENHRSFTVGDTFVKETVTAHYSNSDTADVTSSATFSGYNMSTTGNQTVTVSYTEGGTTKTATYSITVNAAVDYTITYAANGGTGTVPTSTVGHGSVSLPSSASLTKSGYVLDGWGDNDHKNNATAQYALGASYTLSADITLYAHWAQTYTVSFNANGGTGNMADVPNQLGSYTLPSSSFTAPSGKTFAGWKAGNAGVLLAAGSSYTVSSAVTFYAQWSTPEKNTIYGSYQLCTSTDDLIENAHYIFSSSYSDGENVPFAINTENTNNRQTTTADISNGLVEVEEKNSHTEEILVLKLEGSTGAWKFLTKNYGGTNGYLANADSGTDKNYLLVNSAEREFTISFNASDHATEPYAAVIEATGGNTSRNTIRYNNNNGSLFACYGSGQNPMYLYKQVDVVAISSLTIDSTHGASEPYFYEGQNWTVSPTYNNDATTKTSVLEIVSGGDYITVSGLTVSAKAGAITSGTTATAVVKAHATDVENSSVYSENCTITITKASITKVEVTTAPTDVSYVEGQTLDLTGMVTTLTWNYGGTTTLSGAASGLTTTPSLSTSLTVAGHNGVEVLVTYSGVTTVEGDGFTISVIAKAVANNGLSWSGMTTSYGTDGTFIADGSLTVTWNDDTQDTFNVATLYGSGDVTFKIGDAANTAVAIVEGDALSSSNNGQKVFLYYDGHFTSQTITVRQMDIQFLSQVKETSDIESGADYIIAAHVEDKTYLLTAPTSTTSQIDGLEYSEAWNDTFGTDTIRTMRADMASYKWTFTGDNTDGYTIVDANSKYIGHANGNSNKTSFTRFDAAETGANAGKTLWKLANSSAGYGTFEVTNQAATTRSMALSVQSTGSVKFGAFATNNIGQSSTSQGVTTTYYAVEIYKVFDVADTVLGSWSDIISYLDELNCVSSGSYSFSGEDGSWSHMNKLFDDDLELEVKAYLKHASYTYNGSTTTATNATNGTVAEFACKYDYVVDKYGWDDFIRRNGTDYDLFNSSKMSLLNIIDTGNTSSIIVVLAMLSLTVYGGYFFLRKKKEQ